MVLLPIKNLKLQSIHKFQPHLVGPFWAISAGLGTYHLDLLPSMATVHLLFNTSLPNPDGPQPAGPPVLEDNSYKVEAILKIYKHGTHAKMKWIGKKFLYNH